MKPATALIILCMSLIIVTCDNPADPPEEGPDSSLLLDLYVNNSVVDQSIYSHALFAQQPEYGADQGNQPGSALLFDGARQSLVEIANDSILDLRTKSFTVSLWIKANKNQHNGAGVIAKGPGTAEQFAIDIDFDSFRFWVRESTASAYQIKSNFKCDDQWHQLTAIRDSFRDSIYLYVDSTLVGKNRAPDILLATPEPISIGARMDADGNYTYLLKGSISRVQIRDTVD